MKKWIFISIALAVSTQLLAQQDEEMETIDMSSKEKKVNISIIDNNKDMQTLFGSKSSVGAFLGSGMKYADFTGEYGLLVGGELVLVANHSMNLGVAGYGLSSPVRSGITDEYGDDLFIEYGYGGILLEPIIASKKLVHVSIPIVLGVGGYGLTSYPYYIEDFGNYYNYYSSGSFLVAEPGLNVELNVFRCFRVGIGGSYRFAQGPGSTYGLSNAKLSGYNVNVSFRFGWF